LLTLFQGGIMTKRLSFIIVLFFLLLKFVPAQTTGPAPLGTPAKEKRPVIFIPGVLGSRLKNSVNDENVWVNIRRSKTDDMRLPMSPNITANKDDLVPDGVIDKIKIIKYFPKISVYQGVVDFLQGAGYQAGDWDDPKKNGAPGDRDTYYLFDYD